MDIKPPSNNLYTRIGQSVASNTQNQLPAARVPAEWKVNQLIEAVITRITEKQLFLEIAGSKGTVSIHAPRPPLTNLNVGDTLQLQLEQLKPQPQFKIITLQPAKPAVALQAAASARVENTPLKPVLENISYIATRPSLRPAPLPAEVNVAVRQLFQQIPSPTQLKTAEQVRNHVHNSGLFLENKIRQPIEALLQKVHVHRVNEFSTQLARILRPQLQNDLGAQLHRLADLLRAAQPAEKYPANTGRPQQPTHDHPVETARPRLQNITLREEAIQLFSRQLESSLTQLQQQQLHHLHEAQSGRPLWTLELPIRDGQNIDLFELRIEEDTSSDTPAEAKKKIWNVTLQFDLEGLGKVKAHIKMQNEHISTRFYSDNPQTLTLFNTHLDYLRNRFNYNGLQVDSIDCARASLTGNTPESGSTQQDELK